MLTDFNVAQKQQLMSYGRRKNVAQEPSPLRFWNVIFFITFFVEKGCSLNFELVKWNFTTAAPPGKNPFGHPWKSFSDAHLMS